MTLVELKRLDEHFQVSIEPGQIFLGRGPLLKIDETNISRKHAKLCIGEKGDLELTCLHRNPIFVKKKRDWTELGKDKLIKLENKDEVKFLSNKFHYKIVISSSPDIDGPDSDSKCATREENTNEDNDPVVINTEEVISPAPTGLKVIKKRKLPDWMQNSSPTKNPKKLSPDKAPLAKENKKQPDIYLENVKLINSAWNSEKIIEPEEEKSKPIKECTSSQTIQSPTSNHDVTSRETEHTDDLTKPSTSKQQARTPMKDVPKKIKESISPNKKSPDHAKNVFPVLVTPNDFIDSDDEPEKENLKQQNKEERNTDLRPSCVFGSSCYRKNPVHRYDEAHPGDDDYRDVGELESEDVERPECEFGTECYRKNPDHRKQFKHSHKPQPRRTAKGKGNAQGEDDSDSNDSFINDESDGWEPVDDTDEDEDWAPKLSPEYA